jgi:hypothetical protein
MRGLRVLRRTTHNFLDTRGALADIADIELSPKYPPEPRTVLFIVSTPGPLPWQNERAHPMSSQKQRRR